MTLWGALHANAYSSSVPLNDSKAGGFAHVKCYTKSTQTDGSDQRGIYWKHNLSGGGDSGECARFLTQVDGAGAIAGRGAHISLTFGASAGDCTAGEGSAVKATLHIVNKAYPAGGTYASVVAECWVEGDTSDLTALQHSLFRGTVGGPGNATAKAKVKYALALDGVTDAAAGMVKTSIADKAADAAIGILINGVPHYLLAKSGAVPGS